MLESCEVNVECFYSVRSSAGQHVVHLGAGELWQTRESTSGLFLGAFQEFLIMRGPQVSRVAITCHLKENHEYLVEHDNMKEFSYENFQNFDVKKS